MNLHLFATDPSALDLLGHLTGDDTVTAVVVPENRAGSEKVAKLVGATDLPVVTHGRRDGLAEAPPAADAALCWMYSQIICQDDLTRYPRGILNMHGGRIPEFRGASVLQWAIIEGEAEIGITWHEVVEAVDAGAIWAESRVPVSPTATAWEVRGQMIAEGLQLFPEAWRRFSAGRAPVRRPDLSRGTVWPQRRREDGRLGAAWPERRVRDMVRALCPPWPPAFLERDGSEISIASVLDEAAPESVPYRTSEGRIVYLLPVSQDRPTG